MSGKRMPVVFVGHGSPMNAIEDSEFSRAWAAAAARLPRPKAILCISAHWQMSGLFVTGMNAPRTIHDFYGFPPELYEARYPAPGSPALAERVREVVSSRQVATDLRWGLDHGCWSVLGRMYPQADVPVVQLSLNREEAGVWHHRIGRELRPLRDEGVLVLGSGNLVHNLGLIDWGGGAYDWAERFDAQAAALMQSGDHSALSDYARLGPDAALAIPTNEHYLPLLCTLGASEGGEPVRFFAERVMMGSISMRSVVVG
jgi:4,5-DOPA dioxygenase extradiol